MLLFCMLLGWTSLSRNMGTFESREPSRWLWSSGILETKGPRGARGLWGSGCGPAERQRLVSADRTGLGEGPAAVGAGEAAATRLLPAGGWVVERRLWGACGMGRKDQSSPANVP